ncbi:hypothetical protein [Marinimicrobium sp. ABcell2]|uniref:hypothetical protein n=1 Tax=Marinimicrobium sp. ABcell2 TaxID=3069751 RepID=UPI0027B060DE|nr:hypothetical protein [Marinimicrobium sp. ABcell2]MDQ2077016.1 hypothetical protein [Marinimicrobium sp. ABcell2]
MNRKDNFEEFLSRELSAKQTYPADDGFTEQVLAKLPAPKPTHSWWQRPLTLLPVLLIGLLVLSQLSLVENAMQLLHFVLTADPTTLLKTGAAISAGILLASFTWLAREMDLV